MLPEALQATLQQVADRGELERVKAVYLVSYCDNPRGVTMPGQRRRELMAICTASRHGPPLLVIDDLAYRPLQLTGDPVPSMLAFDPTYEHTILAGTFSKSFSPGVRVGWGVMPKSLVTTVANLKGNIDFGSPQLNQHLMHRALRLGLFDQQVERLRSTYHTKLDVCLGAIERSLGSLPGVSWVVPSGGLYVWVELPPRVATGIDGPLFHRAVERGVLYVPGEHCYPEEGVPRQCNTMRLSFGAASPPVIAEGIAILGQAIRDVIGTT
jgi:2-aminoadipate transaminase